jgi:hypothetical protein
MPRARQYENNAARQKAYRDRLKLKEIQEPVAPTKRIDAPNAHRRVRVAHPE